MDVRSRRGFLRTAAAIAALGSTSTFPLKARAGSPTDYARLWKSADVLIGQSVAEQVPSPVITCPMYLPGGSFADATHSLDLTGLANGIVTSDLVWDGDTITPDLGDSVAASTALGSDGQLYLLVGGEGEVTGGSGRFNHVSEVIVRCKYKIAPQQGLPLLVACSSCVAILVRA